MRSSILDDCLPAFHFGHRHAIAVAAPPDRVSRAADAYRLDESGTIRLLFRLRGLPAPGSFRASLRGIGFVTLGEAPSREAVFGLALRLFSGRRVLAPVAAGTPSAFRSLSTGRTIKIAANLRFDPLPVGGTRLSTETRVACTDRASRAAFAPYWILIRVASGVIRRVMLQGIQKEALGETAPAGGP